MDGLLPSSGPPGYVFVPSGNVFIKQNRRKLAEKVYDVCVRSLASILLLHRGLISPTASGISKKKPCVHTGLVHIGLYVPQDIFEKVDFDFKVGRERTSEELWRVIDEKYPYIPAADRSKLHGRIISRYPNHVGKSALEHWEHRAYVYARRKYISFTRLSGHGEQQVAEEISLKHEKAE